MTSEDLSEGSKNKTGNRLMTVDEVRENATEICAYLVGRHPLLDVLLAQLDAEIEKESKA